LSNDDLANISAGDSEIYSSQDHSFLHLPEKANYIGLVFNHNISHKNSLLLDTKKQHQVHELQDLCNR